MKSNHLKLILLIIIVLVLFNIEPIYAGPGGAVTKAIFKSWWGKLLMLLLVIIFAPLIIYSKSIEFFKIKKTKKQLRQIGLKNKDFSWLNIEKNISNIFTRTYLAWSKEDMSEVKNYVNHWYWQNQQLVILDKWKEQNLQNICDLQYIRKIKPLYLEFTEEGNFEGSKIAVLILADIEDYIVNRTTRQVVEGKKGYIEEGHIWIMEYTNGKWLLDNIATEDYSLAYLKMKNIIPEKYLNLV